MARTTIKFPCPCSRGAAKSKMEQYLTGKEFQLDTINKDTFIWYLQIRETSHMECVTWEFSKEGIELSVFIGGIDKKKKYSEENLKGLHWFFVKRKLGRVAKDIQKLF